MSRMFDPVTPGPDEVPYLYEEYQEQGPPASLGLFYRVKPAIPRPVQILMRQGLARRQAKREFPAWPTEDIVLRRRSEALAQDLHSRGSQRLRTISPWPDSCRFGVMVTHDVEGPLGVERIPELLEVEQRHGFVSSWNFVGDWYPVADSDLARVREAGCEVGLHGITHDGQLFRDRDSFEASLPRIRDYLKAWDAVGFRSPSTLRNAAWMHELPVSYDSSFPHSDPFQPQPGGCCWIFPFFFGDVVELPITLDQDHTVFVLLRDHGIERWAEKCRWLIQHRGLINVIVHPDYMNRERLAHYDRFLEFLSLQSWGWHALPREIASWWRERGALMAELDEPGVGDPEPDLGRANLTWVRPDGGRILYEL